MLKLWFLHILACGVVIELCSAVGTKTRFKSVSCFTKTPNVTTIHKCEIKAVSRAVSCFILYLTYHRPLTKFYLDITMYYRYGLIYREVLKVPKTDWCGLMDGSLKNMFIDMFTNLVKGSAPHLVHKCPYVGRIDSNITLDDNLWLSMYPTGLYKYKFNFTDADGLLLHINFVLEAKSAIKTSF